MVIISKMGNLLLVTKCLLDGEFDGESNDVKVTSKRFLKYIKN